MAAWQYDTDAVDGGQRVRVSVHSMLPLDVDGRGLKPARLAFEDHPVWGYDCALELGGGDFECPVGCSVQVSIDGATPFEVLASRPQDADPPRLSLREPRDLWYALRDARLLVIRFDAAGGKPQQATFDVTGVDRGRLDWDAQAYAKTWAERTQR